MRKALVSTHTVCAALALILGVTFIAGAQAASISVRILRLDFWVPGMNSRPCLGKVKEASATKVDRRQTTGMSRG